MDSAIADLRVALCVGVALLAGCAKPESAAIPQSLRAVTELTIGRGSAETRDEYLFEAVSGLAFDSQDRILVSDNKANTIRVFAPDGTFEFAVGRAGQGPGEFNTPCCIAVRPGDTLWVEDWGHQSYDAFALNSRGASYVRSVRMPSPPTGQVSPISWDPEGLLVHITNGPTRFPRFDFRRVFLDSVGGVVRKDTTLPAPVDSIQVYMSAEGIANVPLYGAAQIRGFGPGGIEAAAVNTRYAVQLFDERHHPLALIQRDVAGPTFSVSEHAFLEAELDTMALANKVTRATLHLAVPPAKPPIEDLTFDLDGRLWVHQALAPGGPHVADVYDRSGRWVTTMEWPGDVQIGRYSAVRGPMALGVSPDSMGGVRVVRVRFR